MYVHTRERDRRPGFDGVKIKLLLLLLLFTAYMLLLLRFIQSFPSLIKMYCNVYKYYMNSNPQVLHIT